MSNAMEELMRLHPASHYGRREHRPSGSVRDERDERLERAGYLLVVGIDHLVHAIAVVGWRIDSITVTNRLCLCCISGGTNTPVLPIQSNRTIYETSTLIVTNTASDADPGENLFYSLENPPTGAVISGSRRWLELYGISSSSVPWIR